MIRSPIIYVVDDDASVCRALSLLLKSHGFKVETFTCAADFLAFKHLKLLSCLILDIQMPDINGFALQDAMATRKLAIPIVFITGYGDIPKSVKAIKAGAVDFLPKPFTKKKLLDAVTRALAKSKVQNTERVAILKINRRIRTLSPRELEIFRFVAMGMLSKQIVKKLGIALQTIKSHRSRVMHKMQAKTVTELIHFAQTTGVVSSQ